MQNRTLEINQFTFGGGIINKGLIGRRDLQKYSTSAFEIDNFIVKRHGTLEKRHGYKFRHRFSDTPVRILPFVFDNTSCDYVVFSPNTITIFGEEGNLKATLSNTEYSTEAIIKELTYVQSGDIIFIASRKVRPRKLMRTTDANGQQTYELVDYTVRKMESYNDNFIVNTTNWSKADTSKKRNVYYCVTREEGGIEVAISPEKKLNLYFPPAQGSYNVLYFSSPGDYNIYRNDGSGWGYIGTTKQMDFSAVTQEDMLPADSLGAWYDYGGNGTYSSVTNLSSPTETRTFNRIRLNVYDATAFIPSVINANYELAIPDGLPTVFTVSVDSETRTVDLREYIENLVETVNADPMQYNIIERRNLLNKFLGDNLILDVALEFTLSPDEDAKLLTISTSSNVGLATPAGYFYQLSESDDIANNKFTDDYIQIDYSKGIPEYRDPFADGNYPGIVTLYQQRMVWASTDKEPSSFWMSVVGDLNSFAAHPSLQEDDMINAELPLTRGPKILHMVSHKYLIALCQNNECIINASGDSALTYKTINSENQSFNGSSEDVVPLVCGNAILFVDRAGASCREYKYDYTLDAMNGKDISVLTSEMISRTGGIVDWTYQAFPDSLVWCVMADGSLAILTYMPEQEVCAWSTARLPEGYKAISISCGDALMSSDPDTDSRYKMSAMALLVEKDGERSLWTLDPHKFVDTLEDETTATIVGRVMTVVPDRSGSLVTRQKRILNVHVRGAYIDALDIGTIDRDGEPLGFADSIEHNRRIENEVLEAQVFSNYQVDPRVVLIDDGTAHTEIRNIAFDIECVDSGK